MASVDSTSALSAHNPEDTPTNADEGNGEEERVEGHSDAIATRGGLPQANGEEFSAAPGGVESRNVPFGFQGTTAILPEVHTVTGEEKEKKIVQVPARLYTFDVTTHTWKERGRGEVRLNDAAQSEGFFQSRLVMRTAGSYHVLLNTHLWAQMKCERANQKSIRITAQHGEQGEVAIFLIVGGTKDIQQLFTAVDRRIEALRRTLNSDEERGGVSLESATAEATFDEDDKESFLDEPRDHSSPDSSPERHVSSRARLAPPTKTVGVSSTDEEVTEGRKVGDRPVGDVGGPHGEREEEEGEKADKGLSGGSDARDPMASDRESTTATPPSSRSPSLGASTTTVSSSDNNAPDPNFSQ